MSEVLTQWMLIKEYMERCETITPKQAWDDLGISKLSTRIGEMRRKGEPITSEWVEVLNRRKKFVRVKRYSLERGVL